MKFKQQPLHYREGLILRLTDKQGADYFAEIAPLPGFSQETLTQVKKQLIAQLATSLHNLATFKSRYSSVQFALDSLFNNESNNSQQTTNAQQAEIDNIPMLQGCTQEVLKQYQNLQQPMRIKLKVARGNIAQDIATFQSLCALNRNLKIRCDANQAWHKQQAELFFTEIDIKQLDYIEEPTSSHTLNLQLAKQYKIRIGLDETLQQPEFNYQHNPCVRAFIIKPTIIGSKQKIDQLVSSAQEHGIDISFSSSFESVIGLQQLHILANHYANNNVNKQHCAITLGIDTLKYFHGTLLTDPSRIAEECQQLEVLWTSH